jgi:uroporphyrinogen-III decarboxylase
MVLWMSLYNYFLRLLNLSARKCLSDDPDAHAKLIQHTCQVLKMGACLPLLDLTVEAELLGAPVEFSEHDAPSTVRRLDMIRSGELII